MAETFAPILLPGLSQDAFAVALGALPPDALKAALTAEPEVYAAMLAEARDSAAYLRLLADSFAKLADRLEAAQ